MDAPITPSRTESAIFLRANGISAMVLTNPTIAPIKIQRNIMFMSTLYPTFFKLRIHFCKNIKRYDVTSTLSLGIIGLSMVKRILVVEDDQDLRNFLKELLVDQGYTVQTAENGIDALQLAKKNEPDLVMLDLGLPQMSGESVCLEIRKRYPQLPIIILTGRDTTSDVINGLNIGADDYITKPFNAEELLARLKARLRPFNHDEEQISVSDLILDPKRFEVKRGEKVISLTPQEFKLLHYLMINTGQVLTRDMILNRIWPNSPDIETRVVDVYVGYLRKKIDAEHEKKLIHSVRGFGYTVRE